MNDVVKAMQRAAEERRAALQEDIDQRGKEAALDFARSELRKVPMQGGMQRISKAYLDRCLALGMLTEDMLASLLDGDRTHAWAASWIADNLSPGSQPIKAIVLRSLRGEEFPKKRRGPKPRADVWFRGVARWVAAWLQEVGVPLYAHGESNAFTAARVIAQVASEFSEKPVSESLVAQWLQEGQKSDQKTRVRFSSK